MLFEIIINSLIKSKLKKQTNQFINNFNDKIKDIQIKGNGRENEYYCWLNEKYIFQNNNNYIHTYDFYDLWNELENVKNKE